MNNVATVWTPHRKGRLRTMFTEGMSDQAIAERMRLTPRAVALQRNRLGLLRGPRLPTRAAGVQSYQTGTLLEELRRRGYSVQITKRPKAKR